MKWVNLRAKSTALVSSNTKFCCSVFSHIRNKSLVAGRKSTHYLAEQIGPFQTSMIKLFCEDSQWLLEVYYFRKKISFIEIWLGPKHAPGLGKKFSCSVFSRIQNEYWELRAFKFQRNLRPGVPFLVTRILQNNGQ